MNIDKAGIDFIKKFEGFSAKPYKVGSFEEFYTWGYGHYSKDVPAPNTGKTITQAQAEELLKKDLATYVNGVNSLVSVKLSQSQANALYSFAYNLGVGAFKTSTLRTLLNKGDFKGAAAEFPKWCNAGGKRMEGLYRRRMEEKALFEKVVAAPKPAPAKVYYVVKSGDNLTKIATNYKTSVANIQKLNGLSNPNKIYIGQKLRVK